MMKARVLGSFALFLLSAAALSACDDRQTPPTGSGGGGAGGSGPGAGGAGGAGGGDAGITIPGLAGAVSATYDEYGLLHLGCTTDDDCYAALGYFHAQNRFFFMDFVRNSVRGSLGQLVAAGNVVLQQDYANRRWFSTPEGEPLEKALYDNASERTRGHLDAYARGVNAWIGDMRAKRNDATLTTEYDFALIKKENIRAWEPEDSAAVGLYVLDDLSNNSGAELALAEALPAYDPALAADLFSPTSLFDAYTAPQQVTLRQKSGALLGPGAWLAPRELYADARASLALVGKGHTDRVPGEFGSNNWVVAPSRTSGGRALLANDPHLSLTNPSIWFPVEIDAKSSGNGDYHVAGSTFPGLPSIMIGHNESIAWGVTTAVYDLADVYVEELSDDGNAVLFEGGEVPIIEKTFEFADASTGTPVQQTFRWVPHHGPIMSEDEIDGTAITIRWVGHLAGRDLDAFFGMGRAASRAEAREVLENNASSANQNFVVIDPDGEIGWYPYGQIPNRPFASQTLAPWLPLPGDGSAEWDGFVPVADLPQLTNPTGGVIATANQDMTGAYGDGDPLNDGQAALQTYFRAEGARQQRILDELERVGNAHSVASMIALQGDTYSLYGELVVPVVLAAVENATLTEGEQALVDALAAWQYTCPTGLEGEEPTSAKASGTEASESIGCTAFHATFYALVNRALADEIAAAGVSPSGNDVQLVARALRDPGSISSGELFWDDVATTGTVETRDDIVLRAVQLTASRLGALGPVDDWRWGRVHTLTLSSIYALFGVFDYDQGPYAAPGGLSTVNVANPRRSIPQQGDPWSFAFGAGASIRVVVEMEPSGPKMRYQLPGGVDLHRDSPFYNNLMSRYLVNEPIDFAFGPGAVANPAVELLVSPAP
jgi:penicillin G amidase